MAYKYEIEQIRDPSSRTEKTREEALNKLQETMSAEDAEIALQAGEQRAKMEQEPVMRLVFHGMLIITYTGDLG